MTYISNSMQSFMPIDLRASQFVRGSNNFLAKNSTTSLGFDKNVSFRKYNADIKELTALSGSMDKLTAVFESHRAELGDIEDKLNRVKDIVGTVKAADDAFAAYTADPINNPEAFAMSQEDRDDYQREINTLFGEIETKVANTKVNGVSLFGGYFKANMIGDNKNEAFAADFEHGYIAAASAGAFTAAANVSSLGKLGRDFSIDGNYMVASALNQGNSGNGVYSSSTAGQGAAFLFNMNSPTTAQQVYNLPGSVPSSGANDTFYREKFGLVHDFGASVELDHTQNLVAIGMADNVDPTYNIGDTILDSNGNARTYATDTRVYNTNGTYKKTNINYVMGQNIYDAQGEKTYYASVTKAFNSDGSYKMQSTGTYAVGDTIKDSNGNNAVYTSTDDLRMFNTDGTHKVISQGTYAVGDNIKDLNGNNVTYTLADDRRMFNTDGSQKVVNSGTYALGGNIKDLNGNNVTYTLADDRRMFNADGTQTVVNSGTYALGGNIKDLNGNDVAYTAVDDRRMFNADGTQTVVNSGTYALGSNIKDLNGNDVTYTAVDDRRMFNADGTQKVVNSGTYALGGNIKDLNGNNVTYTATDDLRVFNADGTWDGSSYHNIGDTKTVDIDSALLIAGSEGDLAGAAKSGDNIQSYGSFAIGATKTVQIDSATLITGSEGDLAGAAKSGDNIQSYGSFAVGATKTVQLNSATLIAGSAGALSGATKSGDNIQSYGSFAVGATKTVQINSATLITGSAGDLAGATKSGDNIQSYGSFAVGTIKKIQLDSSASTSSVGYLATGIKAGQSRDGYGYHALGAVKKVELGNSPIVGSIGFNALQTANTNYQNALRLTGQNQNFLGGIKKAGDSIDVHVTHAAGAEQKIELANTVATNTVGWASSGKKVGQAAIRQEYNLTGSTMRIEMGTDAQLIVGSPGELLARESNRLNVNFIPNRGDRRMINADNSIHEHGGAVYLFQEDNSNFIREFKPAGLKDGDQFGSEIVIEGDKIFIGAAGDDAGGTNAGAVYVYNVNTGNLITKINGSTANAAVGSNGSITASDGQVAIGRLAGTAGKTKVDIFNVNNVLSPIRSLEGDVAGDNFGYSMRMKKNAGTGVNELLISSSNSNTGDGKLAIYNTNTGNIVIDANGQEAKVSGSFAGSNPAIGTFGVDFSDTYMVAKGSDGLVYTYNRDDKALKKVNLTDVNQQKFEIIGNMLHLGEYGNGNKVGVYDVTSNPTIEGLNMDITLRDVANGLSATLTESIANLSVSDQVSTILGTTGDNDSDTADSNAMDVVLRNFETMKQNYEDTISKLKKQSASLIDKKDKLTNTQKFDEANVNEVLNKVYGSKPFNLSNIMQPFDRNIVSSLLP